MELYLPSDEIRALEAFAEAGGMSGIEMIRKAAGVCADYIKAHYAPCKIIILCGSGNNGADGLALAVLLQNIHRVAVYQPCIGKVGSPNDYFNQEAKEHNIEFVNSVDTDQYDLIIDAVYGIGFRCPLSDEIRTAFNEINHCGKPIISIDIPSGVEANTAKCDPFAVQAEITLTFTAKKPGLIAYPGAENAGQVILLDAGIPVPEGIHSQFSSLTNLCLYPNRPTNSHKGTFGSLCLFAGSFGMAGAAYLSALAAYRCGVGLVKIVTPNENRTILQTLLPEAVLICYDDKKPDLRAIEKSVSDCNALVAGPGIGLDDSAVQILNMLMSAFESKNMILDADALNLISKYKVNIPRGAIITPHPKEFSRLTEKTVKEILDHPLGCAMEFSIENQVVTLLKGARTIISNKNSDVRINTTGNSGMATAGSGDVLSGIIGALLCLGLCPFDAASLGAYIHGKAGDAAAEKLGKPSLMASDIANSIADVLKKV